jgi:hypothetical protein
MGNRKITLIMTAALLVGSVGFAYADTPVVTAAINSGDTIKLSLIQATEKMLKDGPGAETAALNLQAAQATAKGYKESASSTNDMLEAYKALGILSASLPTESDVNIIKLQRDFAVMQGPLNFEAEMNVLKSDTIKNYFSFLQAQDAVKIQQENLAVQERITLNTKKKFELGIVAKQDVLQAEIAVLSAKDGLRLAENGLALARMGFNNFLGNSVMQKLELTDTLKAVEVSPIALDQAIERALANRNEIKAAKFGKDLQDVLMKRTQVRFSSASSTFLKQKAATLHAEAYYIQAVSGIEIDVRSKYMSMMQTKAAIEKGTASVDKAKELLRLAELSYSVGMNTVTDVQQVQILVLSEELSLSQAILDYNLAVDAYDVSMTNGTFSAPL